MNRIAVSLRAAATVVALATLSLPVALVDPSLASKPATAAASKMPAQVIQGGLQSFVIYHRNVAAVNPD